MSEGLHRCLPCGLARVHWTSLVSHIQDNHLQSFPGYTCRTCGTTMKNLDSFINHSGVAHGKTQMELGISQNNY